MGAMAWCVHSDGSHRASPKSDICVEQRLSATAAVEQWKQEQSVLMNREHGRTWGW